MIGTCANYFADRDFPSSQIVWNGDLERKVERFASTDARFHDYELFWIARVLRRPWLKASIIRNLQSGETFRFWSAKALVDNWGAKGWRGRGRPLCSALMRATMALDSMGTIFACVGHGQERVPAPSSFGD